MSNRQALFLGVNIRVNNNGGRRVKISPPPIALYVLRYAASSLDALIELIPGKAGEYARAAQNALYQLVSGIMRQGPNDYASIKLEGVKQSVRVRVKSF